jgi:hypothetical protein
MPIALCSDEDGTARKRSSRTVCVAATTCSHCGLWASCCVKWVERPLSACVVGCEFFFRFALLAVRVDHLQSGCRSSRQLPCMLCRRQRILPFGHEILRSECVIQLEVTRFAFDCRRDTGRVRRDVDF